MVERLKLWLGGPRWPWVAGLVAVVLAAPTLGAGLMLDDHSLQLFRQWHVAGGPRGDWDLYRFHDGDQAGMRYMAERGMWPWWTAPGLKLAFFRPLSSLWFALDFSLFGRSPWIMHAESVLLLGAGAVLATRLYRRVFPVEAAWAAGLAGLMYAADDAHSMPVVWLSNRSSLLTVALGVGALILHDRGRRGGDRAAGALGPACYGLALLAGESALAVVAYLAAHALFLDDASWRKRLGALAPYAAVSVLYAIVYKAMGYGAAGGGMYLDPLGETGAFVREAAWRLPALLLGQVALPPSEIWTAMPASARPGALLVALLVLGLMAWVTWRSLAGRREAGYFAVGLLLSLLPVAATVPNDRLLMFTGIGAFGLIGALVDSAWKQPMAQRPARGARALAGAMLVVHLGLAPPLLPLRAVSIADSFRGLGERAEASMPPSRDLEGKSLVVLNAPDALVTNLVMAMRVLRGEAPPEVFRVLAVAIAGAERLERPDERTLSMSLSAGLLHDPLGPVFRSSSFAFKPGDRITLPGFEVEVTEVLPGGKARTMRFHFDRPLEDPSLVWITWAHGGYRPWVPIAVGASVELPVIDYMKALQNKD